MNKFNKTIGNFNIKLTNTMITITYEGSLVKAFDTNPLHSFDKLNQVDELIHGFRSFMKHFKH